MHLSSRKWRYALILLIVLGTGPPVPAQRTTRDTVPQVGIDQKLGELVPLELELVDESNELVSIDALLDGKPAVLALVYYRCPMLCGQVLNGLLETLHEISLDVGEDFNVLTVSFDPNETPALARSKKKKYITRYDRAGAEQGWHFLTGTSEAVKTLADAVGFRYTYDPDTRQFAHAAGIMVLAPDGRIARYFYGIEYSPRDLRLGLVEASEGTIGSPVDQLLLLCYHYDPTRGRYGLVIMRTLRIAGALTVVAMVTLVYMLVRRDRRRRADSTAQNVHSSSRPRDPGTGP